jgi:hypothetical protein
VRALRPLADDRSLLSAINHGEFAIPGFRNRDLRAIFFRQTIDDKQQRRRQSAWISRKLRLLRAHALITKIVGRHRYQLTSSGRRIIVAILSALRSPIPGRKPLHLRHNEEGDRLRGEGCTESAGGASWGRRGHGQIRLRDDGRQIGAAIKENFGGAVRGQVGE